MMDMGIKLSSAIYTYLWVWGKSSDLLEPHVLPLTVQRNEGPVGSGVDLRSVS